jgi:hypothetical protein
MWFDVALEDENGGIEGWIQRCPQCMAQGAQVISGRNTLPKEVD